MGIGVISIFPTTNNDGDDDVTLSDYYSVINHQLYSHTLPCNNSNDDCINDLLLELEEKRDSLASTGSSRLQPTIDEEDEYNYSSSTMGDSDSGIFINKKS